MVFNYQDYRIFLKSELADRINANPAYSIRAFARQLGIHHTTLIQVLRSRRSFSVERAHAVAAKLGLKGQEHEYFCTLVELASVKRPERRHVLLSRLSAFSVTGAVFDLTVDHFKVISDWYHLPIMQMTMLRNFSFTPKAIADRLGIDPIEAEVAIERLLRLKLLEQTSNGKYRKTQNRLMVSANTPNEALRNFHKQMLEKAVKALEMQTPSERLIRSETFAFDISKISEVQALMNQFFESVVQLVPKGKKRDQVYHLNTSLFNLTKVHSNQTKERGKL